MRRRTWIILAAAVLVVLGAVTLLWFQPQKLFYDTTVDEAIPSASATAEPVELARGTFISREHETTGTARILRLPDGQQILRLEGFETSNGPALFVYLSQNPADGEDGSFDDDYLDLGALKGNIGDQNYVIPAEIDPLGFTSVVVWCDRFNVSFGAADIVATDM
jgi:hypothetical protein